MEKKRIMSKPLEGIRVLELATFVAAPCVGRFLADLGAEVIKIEKGTGDDWRYTSISLRPQKFTHELNPIFDVFNTGKKFITLNMKTPEGMEIFYKILDTCDVLLTNMRLKALIRLGLDYDSLKEKYPKLIYAAVTGYGEKGPDADLPAFDNTAFWSRCGMLRDLAVVNENGSYMPAWPTNGAGDIVTSLLLLTEINTALLQRDISGKGQKVESCLYHNGIFAFGTMITISQKPCGKKYPAERYNHNLPGGSYECQDGKWIFLETENTDAACHIVANAIGKPEIEFDERFDTPAHRKEHLKEYYEILRDAFIAKTRDEWIEIFKAFDFAVGKMNHFSDAAEDIQAWENKFIENVTYNNGVSLVVPSSPFHMSSIEKTEKTKPSPLPGRDNKKILSTLGYSENEIKNLEAIGVTASGIIE